MKPVRDVAESDRGDRVAADPEHRCEVEVALQTVARGSEGEEGARKEDGARDVDEEREEEDEERRAVHEPVAHLEKPRARVDVCNVVGAKVACCHSTVRKVAGAVREVAGAVRKVAGGNGTVVSEVACRDGAIVREVAAGRAQVTDGWRFPERFLARCTASGWRPRDEGGSRRSHVWWRARGEASGAAVARSGWTCSGSASGGAAHSLEKIRSFQLIFSRRVEVKFDPQAHKPSHMPTPPTHGIFLCFPTCPHMHPHTPV